MPLLLRRAVRRRVPHRDRRAGLHPRDRNRVSRRQRPDDPRRQPPRGHVRARLPGREPVRGACVRGPIDAPSRSGRSSASRWTPSGTPGARSSSRGPRPASASRSSARARGPRLRRRAAEGRHRGHDLRVAAPGGRPLLLRHRAVAARPGDDRVRGDGSGAGGAEIRLGTRVGEHGPPRSSSPASTPSSSPWAWARAAASASQRGPRRRDRRPGSPRAGRHRRARRHGAWVAGRRDRRRQHRAGRRGRGDPARRRGVTVFYRRGEAEAPAYPHAIELARSLGVRFQSLSAPVEISGADGRVSGTRSTRCSSARPTSRPASPPSCPAPASVELDAVVVATGQEAVERLSTNSWSRPQRPRHRRPATGRTDNPRVWAGGDVVNGGREVVDAVQQRARSRPGRSRRRSASRRAVARRVIRPSPPPTAHPASAWRPRWPASRAPTRSGSPARRPPTRASRSCARSTPAGAAPSGRRSAIRSSTPRAARLARRGQPAHGGLQQHRAHHRPAARGEPARDPRGEEALPGPRADRLADGRVEGRA